MEPVHATAPFSLSRLELFTGLRTAYGSRPILGTFVFLVSSLFGASAAAYQCLCILLVLVAALSLRSWLMTLFDATHEYRGIAADMASIGWMTMPWMTAVTAWPIMANTLLAQIFFTEAARMLNLGGAVTVKFAARFGVLLMASMLTYEAFYFQIFLLIGLWMFSPSGDGARKRGVFKLAAIAALAQVLPIALNRYVASIAPTHSKAANTQWRATFVSNVERFPEMLASGLRGAGAVSLVWVLWIVVCAACLAAYGFAQTTQRPATKRVLMLVLLTVISFFISTFVYSVAGYGFTGTGLGSRTLYPASWALTTLFFALLACTFTRAPGILKGVLAVAAAALVTLMAVAQHVTVQDWAHVWRQERAILAAAPVAAISRVPRGSAILYLGPSYYKDIVIFGAFWELTDAVFAMKPLNEGRKPYQGMIAINPATEMYQWSWDGSQLRQDLPGYWTQSRPASRLYIWDYPRSSFYEVKPGFRWPPL